MRRHAGSPVVELNRAIAVAETEGPEVGLRIVDDVALVDVGYLHSTRADLLRRLVRIDEAREAYRQAWMPTEDGAERRFLERRPAELAATTWGAKALLDVAMSSRLTGGPTLTDRSSRGETS
jgi:RNA polymerase sigma-70 factor (ECF subfamily)